MGCGYLKSSNSDTAIAVFLFITKLQPGQRNEAEGRSLCLFPSFQMAWDEGELHALLSLEFPFCGGVHEILPQQKLATYIFSTQSWSSSRLFIVDKI